MGWMGIPRCKAVPSRRFMPGSDQCNHIRTKIQPGICPPLRETTGNSDRFEGMMRRKTVTAPAPRIPVWTALWLCVFILLAGPAWTGASTAQARQSDQQRDVHAQRVMIRGLTWLQNGYPDRAAAVYSEGLKVHPENAAILASMATAQQAMGELGTARFYLDQALQYSPDQPALITQDLDLALSSGDRDAALAAVERMLALGSMDSHYLLRHLNMLMQHGSSDLGPALATRSLELFPDDVDLIQVSLSLFVGQGELDAAIRSAQRINELRGSIEDRTQLSRLLMQNGQWNEAADILGPLVTEEADDPQLLEMMADLNARLPDRDLARETGVVLAESGQSSDPDAPTDSLAFYRQSWEDQPEDESRVVRLAEFLIRADKTREAAFLMDEHVAEYPRHLQVWTLTMETWLAANEPETALARSEDAILLFPGYPPIVLARAKALAATGNHEAAVETIDGLLERLDAESAEAGTARGLRERFLQPQ